MKAVYRQELPHFLDSISQVTSDLRFSLPNVMVDAILDVVIDDSEYRRG